MRRTPPYFSLTLALLFSAAFVAPAQAADERKFQGKTIAEWVADFGGSFSERQKATRALVEAGTAAVPTLVGLVKNGAPTMGQAMQTLAKIGPAARPALKVFIPLLRDRGRKPPKGWTWNVTPRQLALSHVRLMAWAGKDLVPVLLSIAMSKDEDESIRTRAARALGGMGTGGEPALRTLTRSESAEVRKTAHIARAENAPQGKKEYFAQLLEQEPCDVHADTYLSRAKGIVNGGKLDPLTERVKMGLRESLGEKPDTELAMTLARILSDQLAGTALCWAAPVDGVRSMWPRENPKESFHTLRDVLALGFRAAEKGSARRREFGEALARLCLLLGDWKRMNRVLVAIGEKPVSAKGRKWMTAPPSDWKNLAANWTSADESMRSGTSTLVLAFEKDGKPLAGTHVLIKEAPRPQRGFTSGIRADMLLLETQPLGRFRGGFGYRGQDRAKTRYAVSDTNGVVRFEKLPAIPVKLEVLVPTANFKEPGAEWELWMEVKRGVFKVASNRPGPNTQSSQSPPGQVVLEKGKITRYPKLVVKSRSGLNINDFASVDRKRFTLTWRMASTSATEERLRYEVELALSAPSQHPHYLPATPTIATDRATVSKTSWPLGEKGVGDIQLVAGNFYWVQVTAYDEKDTVAFRSPKARFWVPWEHRASDAPAGGRVGSRDTVPITHGKWWRGSTDYGDGTKENLRQQVARFLKTRKKAFEYEYVRLGSAWLDWRDGKPKKARSELARLMKPLPAGNVARATAAWLIAQIDAGGKCPKRLNFVVP